MDPFLHLTYSQQEASILNSLLYFDLFSLQIAETLAMRINCTC